MANSSFSMNQMLEYDEDRITVNNNAGNYASIAQRTNLSSQTGTNTFYLNLRSFFDETKSNLLTSSHNIQLRIFLEPLQNCFHVTSGTLNSCAINSASAICSISRLDTQIAQQRLQDMTAHGQHHIFRDLSYFTYTIPAGTKRSVTILSGIVGAVSSIYFTVRASTTTNQKWIFKQIESFAILNASSSNIVGGQDISASQAAGICNTKWCKSSYNSETSFGITDNSANFYCWAFSADAVSSLTNGQALETKYFKGTEQLVINLPAAVAGQLQVDVYANLQMVLHSTPFSVKKESL